MYIALFLLSKVGILFSTSGDFLVAAAEKCTTISSATFLNEYSFSFFLSTVSEST
jgi:hypothetical protein